MFYRFILSRNGFGGQIGARPELANPRKAYVSRAATVFNELKKPYVWSLIAVVPQTVLHTLWQTRKRLCVSWQLPSTIPFRIFNLKAVSHSSLPSSMLGLLIDWPATVYFFIFHSSQFSRAAELLKEWFHWDDLSVLFGIHNIWWVHLMQLYDSNCFADQINWILCEKLVPQTI